MTSPLRIEGERVGVARVGRARRAAWAAAGFFGALSAGAPAIAPELLALTAPAFVASVLGLIVLSRRDPGAIRFARGPGSFELDGEIARFETARDRGSFRRSEIVDGWLEPLGLGAVLLQLTSGDVVGFDIGDEPEGRRVLTELGVSAAQGTVRVRLASAASQRRFGRFFAVAALGLLGVFGLTTTVALAAFGVEALLRDGPVGIAMLLVALPLVLLVLAGMSLAAQYLSRPVAVIGADGLDVRGFLKRRFVHLTELVGVEFDGQHVRLALQGGRGLALAPASIEAGDLLESRLKDAMNAARSGVAEAKLALLDRSGATVDAWRSRLAELTTPSGYRHVHLDAPELFAVLEDAQCAPERRIAAAFALSSRDEDGARTRLRVAASGCASEPLRVALERAAEGELEAEEAEEHVRTA